MVPKILLKDILLSPRAVPKHKNGVKKKYSSCDSCHRSLLSNDSISPPKFSIANLFAIGHLPYEFTHVSDIVASTLSPVRPFAYLLTFQGGHSKSLKGKFTFFDNNAKRIEVAMRHIQKRFPNNLLHCIICGRFTPEQRILAKQCARVDV